MDVDFTYISSSPPDDPHRLAYPIAIFVMYTAFTARAAAISLSRQWLRRLHPPRTHTHVRSNSDFILFRRLTIASSAARQGAILNSYVKVNPKFIFIYTAICIASTRARNEEHRNFLIDTDVCAACTATRNYETLACHFFIWEYQTKKQDYHGGLIDNSKTISSFRKETLFLPWRIIALRGQWSRFLTRPLWPSGIKKIFFRESRLTVRLGNVEAARTYEGEQLHLRGVQRQEMGSYLCIASNGVPPSISKRYYVNVRCKCTLFIATVSRRLIASFSLKSSRWLKSQINW